MLRVSGSRKIISTFPRYLGSGNKKRTCVHICNGRKLFSSEENDKDASAELPGRTVRQLVDESQTERSYPDFEVPYIPDNAKKTMVREKKLSKAEFEPKLDPSDKSVILFPGQGSQFVGMGRPLLAYPNVKHMFKVASSVLGFDLLNLCLNGPSSELDQTVNCQPAILVTSLAALEKLKVENPQVIENCVVSAGFSVGEYTALVFSGALTFEDGVELVQLRAEAMQRACDQVSSGMLSMVGRPGAKFNAICREAENYCQAHGTPSAICRVANYLFPHACVAAGSTEALEFIEENTKLFRLRSVKRLPVSGAFHTPLMAAAADEFREALDVVAIEKPLVNVYSNVTGKHYNNVREIHKLLANQMTAPVKWEQIMNDIYIRKKGRAFPQTFEVGPGKQLGTILRQIHMSAWKYYQNVQVD